MTDLETLREAWEPPTAPSPAARAEARAALLARAVRRPRRRRRRTLLALAGATAAVIVATNLGGSSRTSSGVSLASAEVLERAASAAERKPFTAPRDDQWIYIEDRDSTGQTRVRWHRADGAGLAWRDGRGKLRVEISEPHPRRPGLFQGYKELDALPTDPDALLRWAYREAENVTGAGLTEHGDVYAILNGMLRSNVVPPDLEAAIFRALKRVPGVGVEPIDVGGRPALAVGQTEDWLREELLLDRETYTYLGERSTVVRDAVIDPRKAGNETGGVTQGDRVVSERIATAIVDAPGERPKPGSPMTRG
jgi:hypothetical protein